MVRVPCEFTSEVDCCRKDVPCYICKVSTQYLPEEKNISSFDGDHLDGKTSSDVHAVKFDESVIPRIPHGLQFHFNNLCSLTMNHCQLKFIDKSDLRGLDNLKKLDLAHNNLEYLPGDLFFYTRNLTKLSFACNKLKYVDPELLDYFQEDKAERIYNFQDNTNINLVFDSLKAVKFDDFKKNFVETCVQLKIVEYKNLTLRNATLEVEVQNLKALSKKLDKDLTDDLNVLLRDTTAKDFTIKIGKEEFKIHKFIFMARSKLFAEMIKANPDAGDLELQDIPIETFKEILLFIYQGTQPKNDSDPLKMFAAASKLKIDGLRNFVANKAMTIINPQNAFEYLVVSNKYNHNELKIKAFSEIKKIFPNIQNQLANEPEKLMKVMEASKLLEEELGKVKVK